MCFLNISCMSFKTFPCFYKLGQLPITIYLKKKRFVSKFSFFFFPLIKTERTVTFQLD